MGKTWGGEDPKDFGTSHAQQPLSDADYTRITGHSSRKKKHSILKWLNEKPKNGNGKGKKKKK